jgi:aspartyl-tRNA synthetase
MYLDSDPSKVVGNLFDLVCNGVELGSGSIRIHDKKTQEKVFSIIGYKDDQIQDRFGPLLESFDYGAPPHGGMGLGIDRLVATFLKENSIRDVISFPKTQSASDLLWGAPSLIDEDQKKELSIKNIEEEGKN